jgi:hypothetical protein
VALPGNLGGIAVNAGGEALAFGLGFALGRALEPAGIELAQEAWTIAPIRAVDAGTAAEIVAEAVKDQGWGATEAAQHGTDSDRFTAMVDAVLNAPGVPELLTLYRRGEIGTTELEHGFRKARLETQWDGPLEALKDNLLDPSVVATAIQRGIIPDPGILPVGPPTGSGKVPAFPVAHIDAIKEAAGSGIDADRLAALVGIVGLPPAPGELLQLVNRGEIDVQDYYRGIAEGNTRNEWRDVLLTLKRRLLTPHEYEEGALRGIITNAEADAGAALSGMEAADAHFLFEIMGRPLAVHQITTGLERGGAFGGTYDDIPEPYRDAVRRSNIRPEYAKLAYANRYTIPSYFILRAILNDGGMTPSDFAQFGKDLGWPPDLAEKAAAALSGGGKAASDPHVTKAANQLWATLHKSYVNGEADAAATSAALDAIGVAPGAHAQVLALWDEEAKLARKPLTEAQIKKAVRDSQFTEAQGLERLQEIGMSAADAQVFLNE